MNERGMYPLTVERPETASQSLLARIDVCPYSGGLYIAHKGGPRSHALVRGELFHEFAERATNLLIEENENAMPPEVAKDLAQELMKERADLSIPAYEQDAVRLMAWNWGAATFLDLERIAAVETMFRLELEGWTIRGRIDRAEIGDGQAYVRDYKTSLAIPSKEDFERDFQSQFYALLVAEGEPEDGGGPLGSGLDGFHRIQEFPRYRSEEGTLVSRYAFSDRAQLHDFRQTLISHLKTLEHGLQSGEWLLTPGSHCSTCPAIHACPLYGRNGDSADAPRVIATEGEAREVVERIGFLDAEQKELRKAARSYAEENGPIPDGDREWAFSLTESDRVIDKDALREFIEEHGGKFEDYFKHTESTRFGRTKVKEVS